VPQHKGVGDSGGIA